MTAKRSLDGQKSQGKVCLLVSYSENDTGRVHSISLIYELCIIISVLHVTPLVATNSCNLAKLSEALWLVYVLQPCF